MITKIKNLARRQFQGEAGGVFRGMITLAMGAGLARIVGLASIPVLTRLYSPEDYGVLAIYTSIVAVLVPILTLRYVTAIPLPKTDAMAFNLFMLCAKLILVGTLLISLVLGFFGETVLGWFSMQEFAHLWWLIAIGVMGTATYELFSLWATRKKDYKVIAKTQFTQSLTGNAVKIGLGLLSLKPLGLVIGQLVAQSGGVGGLFKNAYKDFKKLYPSLSTKKQKIVAKYYQEFPWFRLPSQFLMVLSTQAPILMMSSLYDKGSTGQLSLAMMALAMPIGLIGGAMSKAYYAEVAALGKNNISRIKEVTFSIQKKLFAIGLPITVIVMLLAKPIFSLVFGESWIVAGGFAAALAPFILLQFTSSPLVQALNVVGSQLSFLIINVIRTIGFIIIFYFFKKYNIVESTFIAVLSGFLCAFYLFQTLFVLKTISSREGLK
ncbi:MAG: lipopolysaccharide biosynthesis protein [Thiopseudomonas sp.]